jgi:thioredoxin-related protein
VLLDNPDQSAAMAYGLGGYPFFVLIDGDGKVVQRGSGEIPEQEFVRLLEQVA